MVCLKRYDVSPDNVSRSDENLTIGLSRKGWTSIDVAKDDLDPVFYRTFAGGKIQIAWAEKGSQRYIAIFHDELMVYPYDAQILAR